jgi:MYXO-CTERM domain-containing protein
MSRRAYFSLIAAAPLLLLSAQAHATLIASESFDCPNGNVLNTTGGVGWTGGWLLDTAVKSTARIQAAVATNKSNLPVLGGSLFIDGKGSNGTRIFRQLDLAPGSVADQLGLVELAPTFFGDKQRAIGKPGGTIWVGFLARMDAGIGSQQGHDAQNHFFLGHDKNAFSAGDYDKDGEIVAFGRGDQHINWGYGNTCSHSVCGPGSPGGGGVADQFGDGTTHWGVLRMKFTANGTIGTFWLDPPPGHADLADNTADSPPSGMAGVHFNWIELGSAPDSPVYFDEYRIGTTYEDISYGSVTCAGVVSSTSSSSSSSSGSTSSGMGGGGSTSSGAGGDATSGAGGAPTTSSTSTTSSGANAIPSDDSEDTGCSCRTGATQSTGAWASVALIALALLRRKRNS